MHGEFSLRGVEDCEHGYGAAETMQTAVSGGDVLVVVGARPEEIAWLVVAPAEA